MRVVRKEQRSKRERRKWARKAPLISTASPVRHVDPASMDNKEVLMAKGKAGKDTVLGDVREGLLNFLNRAHLESWYNYLIFICITNFVIGDPMKSIEDSTYLVIISLAHAGKASSGSPGLMYSRPNAHCTVLSMDLRFPLKGNSRNVF